jgi:ribose transport system ATP-binding protein
LGVVVVSSELEELCGFCTRILVMREGELVAEVDGAAATELELLRHAMPDTQEMLAPAAVPAGVAADEAQEEA